MRPDNITIPALWRRMAIRPTPFRTRRSKRSSAATPALIWWTVKPTLYYEISRTWNPSMQFVAELLRQSAYIPLTQQNEIRCSGYQQGCAGKQNRHIETPRALDQEASEDRCTESGSTGDHVLIADHTAGNRPGGD